jgi:uncharacterized glyoxalase superfamily protein PhnB
MTSPGGRRVNGANDVVLVGSLQQVAARSGAHGSLSDRDLPGVRDAFTRWLGDFRVVVVNSMTTQQNAGLIPHDTGVHALAGVFTALGLGVIAQSELDADAPPTPDLVAQLSPPPCPTRDLTRDVLRLRSRPGSAARGRHVSSTLINCSRARPPAADLRFSSAPQQAISDRVEGSILCGVHTKPERVVTALLLGYEDLERARAFFLDALGFEDEWEVRDDSGDLARSHLRFGDTVLMLDKPGAHNVLSPRAAGGVTHLIVISVGDVDAHHARAAGAGATVLVPPFDRPWGRDYEISDPEGYVFSFIS